LATAIWLGAQTTNRLSTAVRIIDDDLISDTGTVTASNITATASITLNGDTRTAWPSGGGGSITLSNDTSLAAGTVSGSSPGNIFSIGSKAQSGSYQMFTSQVSTNGSYNMTTADIGKLFSYDVTSSPTFSLTNANLFASGQAVGFLVDSGTTNTLANMLNINPASGDTINSMTNLLMGVKHNCAILVSDGVSKWHPIALQSSYSCYVKDVSNPSIAASTPYSILFNDADSEHYDLGGFHSISTNPDRFYAPVDGLYLFNYAVQWTPPTTAGKDYTVRCTRNGTNNYIGRVTTSAIGGSYFTIGGTGIIYMNKGDYWSVETYHIDGANEALNYAEASITLLRN
jgi:hypothetical protein